MHVTDCAPKQPPPTYVYSYTANPSPSSYAVPYPHPSPNPGYTSTSPSTPQVGTGNTYRPSQSSPELDAYEDESDFYASPFDGEVEGDGHPYTVPGPARSTSTTSSAGTPSMTKSRWGLKLQLQQLQTQASASMPSLPAAHSTYPNAADTSPDAISQRYAHLGHGQPSPEFEVPNVDTDVYKHAYNYPLAKQLSPIAEQDYFSPTPQSEGEARSLRFARSAGIFGGGSAKASPAAESILGSISGGRVAGVGVDGLGDDKASMRTRASMNSVRTISGNNNAAAMSLSRAASISMSAGGSQTGSAAVGVDGIQRGISSPSPVGTPEIPSRMFSPCHVLNIQFTHVMLYYLGTSPFISRHLNRTASQTSSKSECFVNTTQTPTHSQAQTPILPQTPRGESGSSTARSSSVAHLSTSTIAARDRPIGGPTTNVAAKETAQTPTSAATTGTGTTTGTMFTPTSGYQQSPIGPQSPNSPGAGKMTVIPLTPISGPQTVQQPPGAILTHTPPVPSGVSAVGGVSSLPKIPSLPTIPPMDLRFSMVGSAAPKDRNSRASRASSKRGQGGVGRLPVIDGSVEGYYEEEEEDISEGETDDDDEQEQDDDDDYEEDDVYDRESLHADSFVTAGGSNNGDHEGRRHPKEPEGGMELGVIAKSSTSSAGLSRGHSASNAGSVRSEARIAEREAGAVGGRTTPNSAAGESFIHERWERDAPLSTSPTTTTFRVRSPTSSRWPFRMSKRSSSSTLTPAFWTFWLGFICPILWLVGGWQFTNAGEMPPKYTLWEWYFWNRRWSARRWVRSVGGRVSDVFGCLRRKKSRKEARESTDSGIGPNGGVSFAENQQRRKGKRRSNSVSKSRAGKVYPALPRWVAEKQSTDDGRMRLNDPKRSLRGISFGYPFISRPPTSQGSCVSSPNSAYAPSIFVRILTAPNRALDQLYGVKLREVRGRPESGRRMFDPWIQRCRYAFCYGMLLLALALCTASTWLIIVNTRKLGTH